MKRSEILMGILRVPLDALAVAAALSLAYWLRWENIDLLPNVQLLMPLTSLPPLGVYVTTFLAPWSMVYLAVAASLRLYALKVTLGPWRELGRVILATLLWLALVMAWFFLVEQQLFFSRALLAQAALFITLFALLLRTGMIMLQRALLKRGIGVRTVLSCGSIDLAESVKNELSRDPRFRYLGHRTSNSEAIHVHHGESVDLILHTDPNPIAGSAARLINECRSHQVSYAYVPALLAEIPHQLSVDNIGFLPVLRFEPTPLDGWGRVWKRIADLVVATLLIILLSPLLLLVAIFVLVCDGWPIFYVSKRIGQFGREKIPVVKFRTMCRDVDARKHALLHQSHRSDGPLFKVKNDPRVTRCGRLLRRFSIDELPQLFNVLVGHLSLVGPRPHLPEEVARYSEEARRVFILRPGATGLAQVSGRSDLTFDEEVRYDMRYIEDWSLLLDAWILWRTVAVVLFGKGAD